MIENNSILNFKKILEYFVAHINYMQFHDSTKTLGYKEYIEPYEHEGNFSYTGQGYKDGNIQKQIHDWDKFDDNQICINIQANFGDYKSKKCYLNWRDTGINIYAKWDKGKLTGLIIGFAYWWNEPTKYKDAISATISSLGLYNGSETANEKLISFFDYFINEIREYDAKKSDYFKEVQHYYELEKKRTKMEQNEYLRNLIFANKNIILTGAPGTGKTYLAIEIAYQIILNDVYDKENPKQKQMINEQYNFVQFHPSFDYTDFVEGLRPIDDGKGNVSFRREDGIFMSFCRKALEAYNKVNDKTEAPKYVFVIDEINRGELSKIFGELFFCIDPGYRGEKGHVKTQYYNLWKNSNDPSQLTYGDSEFFYIPDNVYIIGTMNDIDRSVESMDFAMRRRFAFHEVKAEDRFCMIEDNDKLADYSDEIHKRMSNLNRCILTIRGLSSAHQIGPAYFLKLGKYIGSSNDLASSWEELWNNHIYGLLFEYLRGIQDSGKQLTKLERAFNMIDKYEDNINYKEL